MANDLEKISKGNEPSKRFFIQEIQGSRRLSNLIIGGMVIIGGIGFVLASLSSYLGKNLLPLGQPSQLIFVPQGILLGIYGTFACFLAIYLWTLIGIDFGSGKNSFDKETELITITRRGVLKVIKIEIPFKEVKAVKLEIREGLNPVRRICLRFKSRNDLPLSPVGQPAPLVDLERDGAQLARFLGVNLEGI